MGIKGLEALLQSIVKKGTYENICDCLKFDPNAVNKKNVRWDNVPNCINIAAIRTYNGLNQFYCGESIIRSYKKFNSNNNIPLSAYIHNSLNDRLKICVDSGTLAWSVKKSYDSNFIVGMSLSILRFLDNNLDPYFVLDGKIPDDKKEVVELRKRKKYLINTRSNKIDDCIKYISEFKNNVDIEVIKKRTNELLAIYNEEEIVDEVVEEGQQTLGDLLMMDDIDDDFDWGDMFVNEINNKNEDVVEYIKKLSECKKSLEKQKITLTNDDTQNFKNLLNVLNVPFVIASNEADPTCILLSKIKNIDYCFSNDMDFLPRGCKNLVSMKSNVITVYDFDLILKELDLTRKQFITVCVLLGTDYKRKNLRLPHEEIFNLVYKHKTIENIIMDFCLKNNTMSFEDVYKIYNSYDDEEQNNFLKEKIHDHYENYSIPQEVIIFIGYESYIREINKFLDDESQDIDIINNNNYNLQPIDYLRLRNFINEHSYIKKNSKPSFYKRIEETVKRINEIKY